MSLDASAPSPIYVSEHAANRWDERTDPTSVSPETAWEHAQRVDAGAPLQAFDEVRIHWPTRTLLLFRGLDLATVYDLDTLEPQYRNAIKHALEDHE